MIDSRHQNTNVVTYTLNLKSFYSPKRVRYGVDSRTTHNSFNTCKFYYWLLLFWGDGLHEFNSLAYSILLSFLALTFFRFLLFVLKLCLVAISIVQILKIEDGE